MAYLVYRSGSLDLPPGHIFPIEKDLTTIGRQANNDIMSADGRASRQHAAIKRDADGAYVLADCDSLNGTMVDGEKIEGQARLQDGNLIQIPGLVLTFQTENDAPAQSSMPLLDIVLNSRAGTVFVKRRAVNLTPNEFRVLRFLYSHAGELCTRDQIGREVWPEQSGDVSDENVAQLVSRLRRKLGDNAHNPAYLLTVRGLGYKLLLG